MYMFILYFIIIFVVSNGLGKILLKEDSKFYRLRSVIGFSMLLLILQLGYYPIQWFRADSLFVHIWTSIVVVPSLVYGFIKLRKADFFFLKHYEFYLILLLVFLVCKIVPLYEAGDDWFYMPLIRENAFTNHINSLNPKTGWDWIVDELYKYQGYYLLSSFIYRIQNIFFSGINSIFISFRTLMSLVFVMFSSILLIDIKLRYQNKSNKWFIYLIELCGILLVAHLEWSHIYWGSFSIFTVFIPLYMVLFNEYFKDNNMKYPLLFVNGALLTLVSSSLFLNVFITFSFFVYSLFAKKVKVEDYYLIMLPTFIYLMFFVNIPCLIILVLLLGVLIFRYKKQINNIINKIDFRFVLVIPIAMFIIGIILKLSFSWSIYRLSNIILIFNVLITLFIFYMVYKKKDVFPMLFAFAIFVSCFFNPIVEPVISKFLTTNQVYYRLFFVTKNPIVIFMILYYIYDLIKNKKLYKYVFIAFTFILIIRYGYILLSNTMLNKENNVDYNYLLRSDESSIDLTKRLEEIDSKYISVVSIYYSPRLYSNRYYAYVYRYPELEKYVDDIVHRVLYIDEDITEEEYINFKNTITRRDYTHIVILKNENIANRIKNAKLIYENDRYMLLEVKR